MIDVLLFVMVAPWAVLIGTTAIMLLKSIWDEWKGDHG